MKSIPFLLLAGFLILPNSVSLAQAPQQPQRVPDGGTREVLISILIPSLPNAPFTATVNTEWIRQLPDGSTITLKNHRAIARDAAGRIFQERCALVPDDGKTKSGVTQIEISDPVAHELYICVPHGSTCQLEVFSPPESFPYTPPAKAHVAGPWQAGCRGARNARHAGDDRHPRRHHRKQQPPSCPSESFGFRRSSGSTSSASGRILYPALRILQFPTSPWVSRTPNSLNCPAASGFWTSASRRNSLHLRPPHRIERALSRFPARGTSGDNSRAVVLGNTMYGRACSVRASRQACLLTQIT